MSHSTTPLRIVIVGAGISGLTAAAALRRHGHAITLLEKSSFLHETGAAINVGANISGLLRDLGLDLPAAGAVECRGMIRYAGSTGSPTAVVDFAHVTARWPETFYLMHRVDLHTALKNAALNPAGPGPLPELFLGQRVERIDFDTGTVVVHSGRKFEADLILGADGVYSTVRDHMLPNTKPVPWGKSAYRWLTPRNTLLADPEIAHMFTREGWFGEVYEREPKFVWYPCRHEELINVVAFVPDAVREENPTMSNKQVLLKAMEDLSPAALKMLSYADEDVKSWPLLLMDIPDLPSKGKAVLLGDALHPMLPFLGQGGAMAVEDAVTLGELIPSGITPDEIANRLELYQQIRDQRNRDVEWGSRVRGMPDGVRPTDFDLGQAMERAHNFNIKEYTQQILESEPDKSGGYDKENAEGKASCGDLKRQIPV